DEHVAAFQRDEPVRRVVAREAPGAAAVGIHAPEDDVTAPAAHRLMTRPARVVAPAVPRERHAAGGERDRSGGAHELLVVLARPFLALHVARARRELAGGARIPRGRDAHHLQIDRERLRAPVTADAREHLFFRGVEAEAVEGDVPAPPRVALAELETGSGRTPFGRGVVVRPQRERTVVT